LSLPIRIPDSLECRSLIEKSSYNNDIFLTVFPVSNLCSSCFIPNVRGQTTGL